MLTEAISARWNLGKSVRLSMSFLNCVKNWELHQKNYSTSEIEGKKRATALFFFTGSFRFAVSSAPSPKARAAHRAAPFFLRVLENNVYTNPSLCAIMCASAHGKSTFFSREYHSKTLRIRRFYDRKNGCGSSRRNLLRPTIRTTYRAYDFWDNNARYSV